MYLYFLSAHHQPNNTSQSHKDDTNKNDEIIMKGVTSEGSFQVPSADGGLEITSAEFAPAKEWLRRAKEGEIILYPPQFLILSLMTPFLDDEALPTSEAESKLLDFVNHSGQPSWRKKIISPRGFIFRQRDGRAVLALDSPGPEIEDEAPSQGDLERVVLAKFTKGIPSDLEVMSRQKIIEEEEENIRKEQGKAKL